MRFALVLLTALTLARVAHAQDARDAVVPRIAVTGEATVSVVPDIAIIEAGATSEAKTAREASEANNAIIGKLLLALKGAGIAEKDLQTQRLSLQPQYAQRANNGPNVLTGYRASNRVSIKLRETLRVAATIDLAVAAGANDIGGIAFSVTQPSKLLDDARVQAIADARRKAEIYAKAVDAELGAPLSVTEQGASPPMYRRMMADSMADSAPASIAQGEETLRVSVSVSWAIKAAK